MSMMVTKKAIYLVDLLLQGDIKLRDECLILQRCGILNMINFSLIQTYAGLLEQNILILKALKKELVGKCKHPKRMMDRIAKGQGIA